MHKTRHSFHNWFLSVPLLMALISSFALGQDVVVLEHKVSGKRITGVITKGRINNRKVFETESGKTLFLNMGDWRIVENNSEQEGKEVADQPRKDAERKAPPAKPYDQSQIAQPDKALSLIRDFMEEVGEARSSKYTQVQTQARIEQAIEQLRGTLKQTPVLEFKVSIINVKSTQVKDRWRIDVSGPVEMSRTSRWQTSIAANITKKQAVALNVDQKITVRFKAELIEVAESDTNALFLLRRHPTGWDFDIGNTRLHLRLTPIAYRFGVSDDESEWQEEHDRREAGFFGISGPMRRVVYVVDRSGSMTDSIMYVKYELKRSIGELGEDAEFHVIFYSTGPPVEMPTRRLVPATERNKKLAFEFIDGIVAQGETDPSKALDRAFAVKPELIYLLTDGEFDKAIIDRVSRLNEGNKVTVHTIGFLYRIGEEVLKQIAKENSGDYKFVSEADLATLGD